MDVNDVRRGDVVTALVKFPRGEPKRVDCKVTLVKETNAGRLVFGHYRTKRGSWSTMERRLLPPFRFRVDSLTEPGS